MLRLQQEIRGIVIHSFENTHTLTCTHGWHITHPTECSAKNETERGGAKERGGEFESILIRALLPDVEASLENCMRHGAAVVNRRTIIRLNLPSSQCHPWFRIFSFSTLLCRFRWKKTEDWQFRAEEYYGKTRSFQMAHPHAPNRRTKSA